MDRPLDYTESPKIPLLLSRFPPKVFQDLDFLGWYSTGDVPNCSDIAVHKQICDINESPVFLKLNPATRQSDLPITVYESIIDIVDGKVGLGLVSVF